jgi:hypothetical protein
MSPLQIRGRGHSRGRLANPEIHAISNMLRMVLITVPLFVVLTAGENPVHAHRENRELVRVVSPKKEIDYGRGRIEAEFELERTSDAKTLVVVLNGKG